MVEIVYDRLNRRTRFVIGAKGKYTVVERFPLSDGSELIPITAKNNLIKHEAVLLPEKPADYGGIENLLANIQAYIARYVDLSPSFLEIAASYVLFTWVFDAFNELPYLRFRGDYGCGKTRALLIIGSICNKPFFASGASTVSPIFHTLDTFQGTLIFDEADFRFSDEKAELSKIFNNGNVRGFPVLRTAVSAKREFDPQAFVVYGPKLVAMRGAFEDAALESRFITEEMGQHSVRDDIPINLPDEQQSEALTLRNELLQYRLQQRAKVRLNASLRVARASHRLNQILLPLLSVVPTEAGRQAILAAASRLDLVTKTERSGSVEARLLEVILDCLKGATGSRVTIADVAATLVQRFGAEFERPITNRYVGSLIQRRLRLFTYKSHGTFVVPKTELPKVLVLCARYGIEPSETSRTTDSQVGGHGEVGMLPPNPSTESLLG